MSPLALPAFPMTLSALVIAAVALIKFSKRFVFVEPGSTLFTVILYCPSSLAIVFAQEATAPRTVFDTPKFFNGIFTEVEMIFMMRP